MGRIYRSDEGEHEIRSWCEQRLSSWPRPHGTVLVDTPLGATHVVTAGEGPPLLLVPGTNFAAAAWLELVERLAATHTVHAVDLPGQPGLSEPTRRRHDGAEYGRWFTEVARAVGAVQPTVVGHSLGALAVLHALAGGAEVRRAVLVDPAGLRRLSVTPKVLRATVPWLRRPDERSAVGLLRMMMGPGSDPDAVLVAWMALVGRHVRSSLAPPALDEAALGRAAAVPIDVLCGEHDVFLPPARLRRAVARRLEGASFHVVAGAGHLVPHERPDAVVEVLRRPLSDVD